MQYTLEVNFLANVASISFEGQGLYSSLRVTKMGQRINLYTGKKYLQSSYDPSKPISGSHWDWYLAAPIFSGNFARKLNNVLVLGLGGGAVVKLYNRVYDVGKIVGVELDPAIIKIAKRFYNVSGLNTEIINTDIFNYIDAVSSTFDVIILDAFRENASDPNSLTPDFLKKCRQLLTSKGVFVINRVNDKVNLDGNTDLKKGLKALYKNVYSLNIHNNIFYICTNSSQAPGNLNLVKKSILELAGANRELSFMKRFNSVRITII